MVTYLFRIKASNKSIYVTLYCDQLILKNRNMKPHHTRLELYLKNQDILFFIAIR